jgi:hypothetical protein
VLLHHRKHRRAKLRGRVTDANAGMLHRLDLAAGSALAPSDDGASVAHAAAWRGSDACNEAHHGLLRVPVRLKPLRGFLLRLAADLADHNDALRLGVVREALEHVDEVGAVKGVATDADARGLSEPGVRRLVDSLVRERARTGDDADLARVVDVT